MTDAAHNDVYLQEAIKTHPELWGRMVAHYRGKTSHEHLAGMVEALAVVGNFDTDEVWRRLVEEP